MGLFSFLNTRIKRLGFWDIKQLQIAAMGLALFIGSYWPEIVEDYRWFWFIVFVLMILKPTFLILKRE
jgi:hypothetical protein